MIAARGRQYTRSRFVLKKLGRILYRHLQAACRAEGTSPLRRRHTLLVLYVHEKDHIKHKCLKFIASLMLYTQFAVEANKAIYKSQITTLSYHATPFSTFA